MRCLVRTLLPCVAPLVYAGPFSFPLPNGFPNPPSNATLEELYTRAGGNFTNAPHALKFDNDSLTSWKLQAFNEFMEVAFFTQLIANITNRVPGYMLESKREDYILNSLKTIQAQEEMHAYNADDAVRYFSGGSHIYPCTYVFPVSDFSSAIAFAQTFTDMYLGLLADILRHTALNLGSDSNGIVSVLAQALGQEGQQSGWFRSLQGKHPSAEPFLTTSTREFAFSWLQRFTVSGSCPSLGDIPLKTFPRMDVVSTVGTGPVTLLVPGEVDEKTQSLAFVNGALMPTVVPFNVIGVAACDNRGPKELGTNLTYSEGVSKCGNGTVTKLTADFPFAHNVMHGLTLAVVVKRGGSFINAQDVTNAAVYGPAVIEIE